MALVITGNNLNTIGNAGQYESDPSTWGYNLDSYGNISRSSGIKQAGNFSQRFVSTQSSFVSFHRFAQGQFNAVANKKYIIRAYIYVSTSNKLFASDAQVFKLSHVPIIDAFATPITQFTEIEATTKTQAEALGTWVQLEWQVEFTSTSKIINPTVIADGFGSGDPINANGNIYVDAFEIYEAVDQAVDPCDIAIDVSNTVIVDESAAAAADGSITIAHTGTPRTTLEYSLDGGSSYQASNQFTGLDDGVYNAVIRESGEISCNSSQSFSVNEGASSYTFTVNVTHESIADARDGRIEVTVTGVGAPFTFSRDGGQIYQSSNVFENLAPATYSIVVRSDAGKTASLNVTVNPGVVLFNNVYFSKNLIPFTRQQTANSSEANYKIYNRVQTKPVDGTDWTTRLNSSLTPNSEGEVTFNNRPALVGIFNPTPPTLNRDEVDWLKDRSIFIRNQYGDVFDELEEPSSLSDTDQDLVVLGGLDKRRYPTLNYFGQYLVAHRKFLTWSPKERIVDITQEDYLEYFVFDAGTTKIFRRVKAYYDDDTTETRNTDSSPTDILFGRVYRICTGPVNSRVLTFNPEKNLIKYEVWLTDQNEDIISETMVYHISAFKPKNTRYLLFLNSLGAWEVLRLTGKTAEQVQVDSQLVEKHLDFDYTENEGQFSRTNQQRQGITSYSTGFFSGAYGEYYAEYLQELVISEQVFDITTGERVPIIIDPGTFRIKEAEDYRYYLRFNAKAAYKDAVFTPTEPPIRDQ